MANVTLGKVAPTPKGEWNGSLTYEKLDIVTNSTTHKVYMAIQNVPANTAITNNEYWEILGIQSSDAEIDDTAGDGDINKVWSANKNYDEITNLKNSSIYKLNNIDDSIEDVLEQHNKKLLKLSQTDLISGYINGNNGRHYDGTSSSGLTYCTDYIEIGGRAISVYADLRRGVDQFNIVEYNENQNYIKGTLKNNFVDNFIFDTNTRYIRMSFSDISQYISYVTIYFLIDYNKPESFVPTYYWRNGSVTNQGNESAIATTYIINRLYADGFVVIVNKPLAEGHKYRYQYVSFDISSGTTLSQTSHIVTNATTVVSEKNSVKIKFKDNNSVGFGFCLYELDENDQSVPLRINNFDTSLIYIKRDYLLENPFIGYISNPMIQNEIDVDLNTFTEPGFYTFNLNTTYINAPDVYPRSSVYSLNVFMPDVPTASNPIYQEFTQLATGYKYLRYRSGPGRWFAWYLINAKGFKSVLFTNPIISKMDFYNAKSKNQTQDIAVYNNHIFCFGNNEMTVDNGSAVSINCGHGNNAMFGTTLHGDFPYLYCGSWNFNDNYITVNEISVNTIEDVTTYTVNLVRTITFSTLEGHLNMVVDEDNNKIYILMNKNSSTHIGDINFVVADLATGDIISQKDLDYAISVIQGMEFHNGCIYITHGGVSPNSNSYISILDINGDRISMSDAISGFGEIEGISFDNNVLYLANTTTIYY